MPCFAKSILGGWSVQYSDPCSEKHYGQRTPRAHPARHRDNFHRAIVGTRALLGRQTGVHLCFARGWLFCVPVRVQCREPGCAPWAVVAAPVPLDLLLLWCVLRKPRKMAVAYVSIWAIYIVIHTLLSALLRYDSLIPAWRLHS
jgi:hypothetical protein